MGTAGALGLLAGGVGCRGGAAAPWARGAPDLVALVMAPTRLKLLRFLAGAGGRCRPAASLRGNKGG